MAPESWTTDRMGEQAGKTILITGANSGIGYQAALELARRGAHVLLGCRSLEKGQAARERILKAVPGAKADVVLLDVASLASVRGFAGEFVSSAMPLDVLINNAGVMALAKREQTVDGFERQFATNHLGHFALTGLLMPSLLRARAPRVVTVASLAHRNGRMDWDNLQSESSYTPWGAYNNSKLANILFARELDRRAKEAGGRLVSVPVHPGISRTSIIENGPGSAGLKSMVLKVLAPVLMQSDAMGALPTLYAATSPEVHGGEYIGPGGFKEFKGYPVVVRARPQALDEQAGRKLWSVSEQLTGVVYPEMK